VNILVENVVIISGTGYCKPAHGVSLLKISRLAISAFVCLPVTLVSSWLCVLSSELLQALFEQILAGLLSRVLEGNGRVQEAACSSLAELLEHAGNCTHGAVLVPRMQVRALVGIDST
jgi:hypothetical protein